MEIHSAQMIERCRLSPQEEDLPRPLSRNERDRRALLSLSPGRLLFPAAVRCQSPPQKSPVFPLQFSRPFLRLLLLSFYSVPSAHARFFTSSLSLLDSATPI